jgi:hypothetical protein
VFVWDNKDFVLASAKDDDKFFAAGEVVPREHLASPERIKALVDAGALLEQDEPESEPKPVVKKRGRPKKGGK